MTKTFKIMDNKAEFKQKGWKLFGAVIVIQTVIVSESYILNSY